MISRMLEEVEVRLRRLPEGQFHPVLRVSTQGHFWQLDLGEEALPLGSLLEIEQGSTLYWGAIQEIDGSKATVSIEHSLDTARLQPLSEIWGE
jgi:hypothetical protein